MRTTWTSFASMATQLCWLSVFGASPPTAPAQGQLDWYTGRDIPVDPGPMTYDAARERVVKYNPLYAAGPAIWEWNGADGESRSSPTTPTVRAIAGFCFDAARRESVLFDWAGDTWLWNGRDWRKANPAVRPSGRHRAGMAYDSARGRVVLFGGRDHAGLYPLGDTWEWDGANWSQRHPATAPPPREMFGIAYDSRRGRVVVTGGNGGSLPSGVWEWDGNDWGVLRPSPAPRGSASDMMCYDSARQRCVFVEDSGRSWEWDGSSWTSIPSVAHVGGAIAYDAARARTVVHTGELGTIEAWDGNSWTTVGRAPARDKAGFGAAVAFDPNAAGGGRVMAFGGYVWDSGCFCKYPGNQTWVWDGHRWNERAPATSPTPMLGHAMFTDSIGGRVILFGDGATWAWNGNDWSRLQPASSPGRRFDHGMAYDYGRARGVLFGGSTVREHSRQPPVGGGPPSTILGDTWEWTGSDWLRVLPRVSPPPRSGGAMALHPLPPRVLLFGGWSGSGFLDDTWEWNGAWQQLHPAHRPPARHQHGLAWNPDRQTVVLYGGFDGNGGRQDTWEWDGVDWRPLATPSPGGYGPSTWTRDSRTEIVFDPVRRAMVSPSFMRPTWLLGITSAPSSRATGSGCGGPAGAPALWSTGPWLNNRAFQLELGDARPGAACVIAVSAVQQTTPLGGGCAAYIGDPVVSIAVTTNALGHAHVALPIPFDATLRGRSLFAQGVVADPLGPLGGFGLTQLLTVVFGD